MARLGTQPLGEGPGQFIAPHGMAVDSRGDIYVAEVANTDHELRSFQKLARVT